MGILQEFSVEAVSSSSKKIWSLESLTCLHIILIQCCFFLFKDFVALVAFISVEGRQETGQRHAAKGRESNPQLAA